ncbi:MAG TPA: cell division protein FtsA, partial [Alphaproteobacteria bacterium]|nr:cell division protein FtsA [Alphaproteobacteria bacterium]
IHVLPKSYTLDNTVGIKDPKGMVGQILAVELVVIAAPKSLLRNLHLVVGRCHLSIEAFICDAYASSLSCLIEDEMELGVTVVDIGGSCMSISCFCEGFLVHTDSILLGGNNITYDVARGLSTTLIQAERLKTLYGTVITCSSDEREMIYVPQIGEDVSPYTHQIPKTQLTFIIKSRVDEMIEMFVKTLLEKKINPRSFEKFVVTGGGAQLPGVRDLFSQLLRKPVRIGAPPSSLVDNEMLQTPMFSALCGGLYFEWQNYMGQQLSYDEKYGSSGVVKNFFSWIKENF